MIEPTDTSDRYCLSFEAATLLRTTAYTVRKYIRMGELKAIKIGKQFLIDKEDLERFISKKKSGE